MVTTVYEREIGVAAAGETTDRRQFSQKVTV